MNTLIIPTKDRSDYLIRQLTYFAKTRYKHWIYIGDSSNKYHFRQTQEAVNFFRSKLKVIQFRQEGKNAVESVIDMLDKVSTPFCVFLPDDDFVITDSINKCIYFLDQNSEYIAAHGLGLTLFVQESKPYIKNIIYYPQPVIESNMASERLLSFLKNYSVALFSVYRTSQLQKIYELNKYIQDGTFTELFGCCMSVVKGKIKQLDHLYLIRQVHSRRYLLPDGSKWINAPDWQSSYNVFKSSLASELADIDKIELPKAEAIVHNAFSFYLAGRAEIQKYLLTTNQSSDKNSFMSQFPDVVAKVLNGYKQDKSLIDYKYLLQKNMIDKNSNYLNDFLPIFDIICKTGSNNASFSNDLLKQGELDFNQGNLVSAEKKFNSLTDDNQYAAMSYNNLGVIAFHRKDYDRSIKYFISSLEIDPYCRSALINVFKVYQIINQYNVLMPLIFTRYIEKFPEDIEIFMFYLEVKKSINI